MCINVALASVKLTTVLTFCCSGLRALYKWVKEQTHSEVLPEEVQGSVCLDSRMRAPISTVRCLKYSGFRKFPFVHPYTILLALKMLNYFLNFKKICTQVSIKAVAYLSISWAMNGISFITDLNV